MPGENKLVKYLSRTLVRALPVATCIAGAICLYGAFIGDEETITQYGAVAGMLLSALAITKSNAHNEKMYDQAQGSAETATSELAISVEQLALEREKAAKGARVQSAIQAISLFQERYAVERDTDNSTLRQASSLYTGYLDGAEVDVDGTAKNFKIVKAISKHDVTNVKLGGGIPIHEIRNAFIAPLQRDTGNTRKEAAILWADFFVEVVQSISAISEQSMRKSLYRQLYYSLHPTERVLIPVALANVTQKLEVLDGLEQFSEDVLLKQISTEHFFSKYANGIKLLVHYLKVENAVKREKLAVKASNNPLQT